MERCLIISRGIKDKGEIMGKLHMEASFSGGFVGNHLNYSLMVFDREIEYIKRILRFEFNIPFIVVFDKETSLDNILSFENRGMVDFLYRPYEIESLTSKINRYVLTKQHMAVQVDRTVLEEATKWINICRRVKSVYLTFILIRRENSTKERGLDKLLNNLNQSLRSTDTFFAFNQSSILGILFECKHGGVDIVFDKIQKLSQEKLIYFSITLDFTIDSDRSAGIDEIIQSLARKMSTANKNNQRSLRVVSQL